MTLEHLVFYDGECGLCDYAVQYILKRDQEQHFCFAPLKGETATRLLQDKFNDVDSLILIEDYKTHPVIFTEGDAIFRICARLPWPYWMLSKFGILPRSVYNRVYRWVARHRKQLLNVSCLLPDPKQPNRFLK